jgi:hypothetical protein
MATKAQKEAAAKILAEKEQEQPLTRLQKAFRVVFGEQEESHKSGYVTIGQLERLFAILDGDAEPEMEDDSEMEPE